MTTTDRELLDAARELLALLDAKSETPQYHQTIRLRDAIAAAGAK